MITTSLASQSVVSPAATRPSAIRKQTDALIFQTESGEDYDFDRPAGWDNDTGNGGASTQQVNGKQLWFFSAYLKLNRADQLTYAACRNATGHKEGAGYNDHQPFGDFAVGDRYCIKAHENRVALETFVSVSSTELTAGVVVYDPVE